MNRAADKVAAAEAKLNEADAAVRVAVVRQAVMSEQCLIP